MSKTNLRLNSDLEWVDISDEIAVGSTTTLVYAKYNKRIKTLKLWFSIAKDSANQQTVITIPDKYGKFGETTALTIVGNVINNHTTGSTARLFIQNNVIKVSTSDNSNLYNHMTEIIELLALD